METIATAVDLLVSDVVDAPAGTLLDPEDAVRTAASLSLGELKTQAAARSLLSWAVHAEAPVRAGALRALRELSLPEAAEPALIGLADASPAVRREAAGVLGRLEHEAALLALMRIAQTDTDAEVRRAATGALGFASPMQTGWVGEALIAALHDRAWPVREEAASMLGKLRVRNAFPSLIDALSDGHWQVRVRAARALEQLDESAAIPALGAALQREIGLQEEAAIARGETASQSAAAQVPPASSSVALGDGASGMLVRR